MAFALFLGGAPQALAQSPASYEKAKQDFVALQGDARRRSWRAPWEELAARFLSIYQKEKSWRNRPAALYRSALAMEELGRRSNRKGDFAEAEKRFRQMGEAHPQNVLADDALFRAARLRNEKLGDRAGAAALLQELCERYPRGDHAPEALKLLRQLGGSPQAKAGSREQAVPSRKPDSGPGEKADIPNDPRLAPSQLAERTVLLDAGHGGRDPGTRHNGVLERELTLDLARRIGRLLAAQGFRVEYTRQANKLVSLDARTERIRATRADIFISIHVNANSAAGVRGFETYYLDFARTSAGTRLAAIENALARRPAAQRTRQAVDRMFRILRPESQHLARHVQNAVMRSVREKKYGTENGGIKTAPFQVLRRAGVPAILLEVGYCTNKTEAELLDSPAYRNVLARGIANGIAAYAGKKGQ